ncbi:nicotinamidase/pyrazinamidase, partial [Tremellales sp. Uapishka_1]
MDGMGESRSYRKAAVESTSILYHNMPTALLIIDVQNDFLPPTGSLAVSSGPDILPLLSDLLDSSKWEWNAVVTSQDYHPAGHISFASSHPPSKVLDEKTLVNGFGEECTQILWPDHCVQGSKGAEIEKGLRGDLEAWKEKMIVVRKGYHPTIDSYSAFEGYLTSPTDPSEPPASLLDAPRRKSAEASDLAKTLRAKGIDKVVIVGLAIDFCISATAVSALEASFQTLLIAPATRAVRPEAVDGIWQKLEKLGGTIVGRDGEWEKQVREWVA